MPDRPVDDYKFHRQRRHGLSKPPPPAPAPPSAFEGIGLFTAHDPRAALRLAGLADWVAVKADGGDRADPAVVPELRAAGFRVHVWEAMASDAQAVTARYSAEAYIGQAEGPGELGAALNAARGYSGELALVTNVFMSEWPAGWFCLGEAYVNANPSATPANIEYEARKRGARRYSPVFGNYDATEEQPPPGFGRRVPLREYLAMWPGPSWASYTAEYLVQSDDDIAALRAARKERR